MFEKAPAPRAATAGVHARWPLRACLPVARQGADKRMRKANASNVAMYKHTGDAMQERLPVRPPLAKVKPPPPRLARCGGTSASRNGVHKYVVESVVHACVWALRASGMRRRANAPRIERRAPTPGSS